MRLDKLVFDLSGRQHVTIFLFFALAGCGTEAERAAAIGEAFVGPITLPIRQDLIPRAPAVATLKHGERVEIIQTRRRFVKVRNQQGVEGWTDGRHLLTSQQMADLELAAKKYAKAPSQGAATVYEALNVHTTPNRGSPSFFQIPEGGRVDLLEHRLEPRLPFQPPPLLSPKPVAAPPRKKKEPEAKVQPPPMPPAPPVPGNWLELSKSAPPEPEPGSETESPDNPETPPRAPPAARAAPAAPAAVSVPYDDWALVRSPNGKVGWVLLRLLTLAIPDEVAQYAEGHRITSYFSLGEVHDGEEVKHNWVWTTINGGGKPYEFDGFRVFTYVKNRHRYETTYRERNLKGYYPSSAHPVKVQMRDTTVEMPGFSLIIEDKDGRKYKRTYVYEGYRVRLLEKTPWEEPAEPAVETAAPTSTTEPSSWSARWMSRISRIFHR